MDENEIYYCECCGREICEDEVYTFDGETLCEDCLHEHTVICSNCDERIWNDDNCGSSNYPLCERCYDNYYTTCEECGRIIDRDEAHYDDDDYPYCDDCYEKLNSSPIHEYSYKPSPIFYGDGKRYFGVELEIDGAGKDKDNAEKLLEIGNPFDEQIYIKSDGSLNDGMEIVSHPMTLDYHKEQMPWQSIMETAIKLGYRSHKTQTCGLHFHINRDSFGTTREIQEERISRVLYFVEHHWEELLKFSRRTEAQMNRWAARYGYKSHPKAVLEDAKKSANGRYACVNLTNWNTIEFRMFRGTLKYNSFIATLELVNLICEIALNFTDEELQILSWTDFVLMIDEQKYPELIIYLKERRLFVNEPVASEEDD